MDVVVIFNGLGNQMSQYAFYLQKKEIDNSTYTISFCNDHNGLEIDSLFNLRWQEKIMNKFLYLLFRLMITKRLKLFSSPLQTLLKLIGCRIINENYDYDFNAKYLVPSTGITFYFGGWHNEKYFIGVKDSVKSAFHFTKEIDTETLQMAADMGRCSSVSLHVRRGDFLNSANLELFGKVCTKSFFEKAIMSIERKFKNPHFYVFSNDMDWVKENFDFQTVTYVTHNTSKNSWRDMYLMSNCKHNIISNSSFSWWGAWLNTHDDKIVISPAKFLNSDIQSDVYPKQWIKLSDY